MIVLVAEDEALLALTLVLQLQAAGHRVLGPASTLEDAQALVRQELPDLALVDIDLQRRGDGVRFARELRHRWHVPSVFMTARPDAARAAADAALGLIAKPYDPADIDDSLKIAESLINGGAPPVALPPALELFTANAAAPMS